jgi:hypothetical protein
MRLSKSGKKLPYKKGTKPIKTAVNSSIFKKMLNMIKIGINGISNLLKTQIVNGKCSFISDKTFSTETLRILSSFGNLNSNESIIFP